LPDHLTKGTTVNLSDGTKIKGGGVRIWQNFDGDINVSVSDTEIDVTTTDYQHAAGIWVGMSTSGDNQDPQNLNIDIANSEISAWVSDSDAMSFGIYSGSFNGDVNISVNGDISGGTNGIYLSEGRSPEALSETLTLKGGHISGGRNRYAIAGSTIEESPFDTLKVVSGRNSHRGAIHVGSTILEGGSLLLSDRLDGAVAVNNGARLFLFGTSGGRYGSIRGNVKFTSPSWQKIFVVEPESGDPSFVGLEGKDVLINHEYLSNFLDNNGNTIEPKIYRENGAETGFYLTDHGIVTVDPNYNPLLPPPPPNNGNGNDGGGDNNLPGIGDLPGVGDVLSIGKGGCSLGGNDGNKGIALTGLLLFLCNLFVFFKAGSLRERDDKHPSAHPPSLYFCPRKENPC